MDSTDLIYAYLHVSLHMVTMMASNYRFITMQESPPLFARKPCKQVVV